MFSQFITGGLFLKKIILKNNNIKNKIRVISNGIEVPKKYKIHKKSTSKLKILYVGIFDFRKGQLDFIKNIIPLLDSKYEILFLGSAKKQKDIDYEKKCIEQASSYSSNTISFDSPGFKLTLW